MFLRLERRNLSFPGVFEVRCEPTRVPTGQRVNHPELCRYIVCLVCKLTPRNKGTFSELVLSCGKEVHI